MTVLATHDTTTAECDPFFEACPPEPSTWDQITGFLGSAMDFFWPWGFLVLLALWLLWISAETVGEKKAFIIERFGKFHKVMRAGLHFRVPLIDRVRAEMRLDILNFDETVMVKTVDNAVIELPVILHYRVNEGRVREAYYELADAKQVMQDLVLDAVRSSTSSMTLEGIFRSRGEIDMDVREAFIDKVGSYGYEIMDVVVNDPELPEDLEAAFNNVIASIRRKEAATADAEALEIELVGAANAEAKSMKIKAEASVSQRNTVAEGFASAISSMTQGTSLTDAQALELFKDMDRNDAIRDASASDGTTIVVATPSPQQDGVLATLNGLNGHTHPSHTSST